MHQPYDMHKRMFLFVDNDSMFDRQPGFGSAVMAVLTHMNGNRRLTAASWP